MGKGRKPISNALKKLKGTDQPCRMREEITFDKITEIPSPPSYLCAEAKSFQNYRSTTGGQGNP